jgi:excisionase family DNA binding protein
VKPDQTDHLSPALSRAVAHVMRDEVLPAITAVIERALANRPSVPQAEFITINETLRALNINRTQCYRLFARGALTPIKMGRSTVVYRDDLHQFVERLRHEAQR